MSVAMSSLTMDIVVFAVEFIIAAVVSIHEDFFLLKSMSFATVTDTRLLRIQIKGRNIDALPERFHSVTAHTHIGGYPLVGKWMDSRGGEGERKSQTLCSNSVHEYNFMHACILSLLLLLAPLLFSFIRIDFDFFLHSIWPSQPAQTPIDFEIT